jgi:PhnB protein
MLVQAYLSFEGRCEEALEFYRSALGAKVEMMMRFKESPDKTMTPPPGTEHNILHAAFQVGDTTLMASDGRCGGKANFQGISLAITVPDVATADRRFAALADGGQVLQPLTQTFFSPRFGMVADRFGVTWMVLVAQ